MSKLSIWIAVVALVVGVALPVSGAPLNGSIVLSTLGATINGSDLANSTLFTPIGFVTPGVFTGLPSGDYSIIPAFTNGMGGAIDTTNINSFNISFVNGPTTYGAFIASTGQILSQSSNFLDAIFIGDFVPNLLGPLASFDVSPTSVRISMNKTGSSTSYVATLASPPEEIIPEPGTYALIGAGLLSMFALRRRRQS